LFACELAPRQALPDDLANHDIEAVAISHLAVVIAKRLFVKIAEQMEGLDADVRAIQAALYERPEILKPVRVDLVANIFHGMVNHFMLKFIQTFVGFQSIGEQCRARKDMLTHFGLQCLFLAIIHNLDANLAAGALAAALQNPHDGGFILAARAGDFLCAFFGMHIAGLAADKSFVRLNLSRELISRGHAESETNAMVKEPCRLLGNADGAMNFVGTDSVLAVHNLPHRHQPLAQVDWGIFHHSSDLHAELRTVVLAVALPAALCGEENNLRGAAGGAPVYDGSLEFDIGIDKVALLTHIAECLRNVEARRVKISRDTIFFQGGLFRFVGRWNILVPFGSGEVLVDEATHVARYRLSLRQLICTATIALAFPAGIAWLALTARRLFRLHLHLAG
jgi:hypothetical protein